MIRQFDVFPTPDSRGSSEAPFICVLQSHYLDALDTVVVAPLLFGTARHTPSPTPSQVAVPVSFNGVTYLLDIGFIANIERQRLRSVKGSLAEHEDDIRRALDRLFTGF